MTKAVMVGEGIDGLELRYGEGRGVALDLTDLARRVREGRSSAIARACGARAGLTVLDAMAGLALDGLTLAALGCHLTLIEAVADVYRVMVDGVERAQPLIGANAIVATRRADARHVLAESTRFDVVYLDPIFPTRHKGALPQKRAQVLAMAAAVAPTIAVDELITASIRVARERVVLKRRARDPVILEPDWTITGNRVRFDVYRGRALVQT